MREKLVVFVEAEADAEADPEMERAVDAGAARALQEVTKPRRGSDVRRLSSLQMQVGSETEQSGSGTKDVRVLWKVFPAELLASAPGDPLGGEALPVQSVFPVFPLREESEESHGEP